MKKILFLLTATALIFALCSCGETEEETDNYYDDVSEDVVEVVDNSAEKEELFYNVKSEVLKIVGSLTSGDGYFTVDTFPDDYKNMDEKLVEILSEDTRKDALEGIQYANTQLGFSGAVYTKMTESTALMGRQEEENDFYRISWTYSPSDGLEVLYELK